MFCWLGAGLGRNNKERDRKMIAAGGRQEVLCVTCHSGSSVWQWYLLFYLWQDVEKTFQELLSNTIYSQSVRMT